MSDDDGYGRAWEYRVFSLLDTEPDQPNSGRRYLTIRKVWAGQPWGGVCGGHLIIPDYPVPDEIAAIDHRPSWPEGATIAELMLDLERMIRACDRPALILAEWKDREARVVKSGEAVK